MRVPNIQVPPVGMRVPIIPKDLVAPDSVPRKKPQEESKGELDMNVQDELKALKQRIAELEQQVEQEKEIEYRSKQEKENGNKTTEEAIIDIIKVFGDITSDSSQNQKDDENIRLLNSFLDSGYNYLARDKNGNLWKYQSIPKRNVSFWNESSLKDTPRKIDCHNFPEVQWSDEEPTRIVDLLEKYQNGGENGKQGVLSYEN